MYGGPYVVSVVCDSHLELRSPCKGTGTAHTRSIANLCAERGEPGGTSTARPWREMQARCPASGPACPRHSLAINPYVVERLRLTATNQAPFKYVDRRSGTFPASTTSTDLAASSTPLTTCPQSTSLGWRRPWGSHDPLSWREVSQAPTHPPTHSPCHHHPPQHHHLPPAHAT